MLWGRVTCEMVENYCPAVASGVLKLNDATPAGVLLGSDKLAPELDRLDLINE